MSRSKKRVILWGLIGLLCVAMIVVSILIIRFFAAHHDPYDPALLTERRKAEIPEVKQALEYVSGDIAVILDIPDKIAGSDYLFSAFFTRDNPELWISSLHGTRPAPYYVSGAYVSGTRPYTFSAEELTALENILITLEKNGFDQTRIFIDYSALRIRIKETHRSSIILTSGSPREANDDYYYFEETDFGLNIEIEFISR